MAIRDRDFRSYVDVWARALRGVRYEHLRHLQGASLATIARGGAGTAYALWRLGRRSVSATAWASAARADRSRAAGASASGFLDGRAGIAMVEALVSRSTRTVAMGRYRRLARGAPASLELTSGAAGLITGARLILAHGDDARLRAAAEALIATTSERVHARTRTRWQAIDGASFAHGWPGVLHALFTWPGSPAPWLVDATAALARRWRPDAMPNAPLRGSWCNGAAGVTLLWTAAYERTREPIFLRTARAAARDAEALVNPARTHLCCGVGGAAYALLALERIDPDHGWRERARALGARAVTTPLVSPHPSGLMWGHPGLVCLALDLMADEPRGFPCIEA